MKRTDLLGTIDDRIDRKKRPDFEEGTIVGVQGGLAKVRVLGGTQIRNVEMDKVSTDLIGKNCLIYWSQVRGKYILVSASSGNAVNQSAVASQPQGLELFPPNNVRVSDMLPGIITVLWDSPAQRAVAFEVESNPAESETGGTSELVTYGSYTLIESDVPLYVRARGISADFHYSAWSDWILGTPGEAASSDFADLSDVDVTGIVAFDIPYWNTTDSLWEAMPNPLFALPTEFMQVDGHFAFIAGTFLGVSPNYIYISGDRMAVDGNYAVIGGD